MTAQRLSTPRVSLAGYIEVDLDVDGTEVLAILLPYRGVGVVDPPSNDVEAAGMEFLNVMSRTDVMSVHRMISDIRKAVAGVPSEAGLVGMPIGMHDGGLQFLLEVNGRQARAVIRANLDLTVSRWTSGALEMSEDEWASIWDGWFVSAISMQSRRQALSALGFDIAELMAQKADADAGIWRTRVTGATV